MLSKSQTQACERRRVCVQFYEGKRKVSLVGVLTERRGDIIRIFTASRKNRAVDDAHWIPVTLCTSMREANDNEKNGIVLQD